MSTASATTQDERRRAALRTLCDLTVEHNLPTPMAINFADDARFYPIYGIKLRLDEGQRDGVRAWAAVLGLTVGDEDTLNSDGRDWVLVKAERWNYEPVWSGYSHVEVWCSCPVEGGAS
jgi:hypothetical protein